MQRPGSIHGDKLADIGKVEFEVRRIIRRGGYGDGHGASGAGQNLTCHAFA
jgi:hypothetical protein